jgi:hypothetical protein
MILIWIVDMFRANICVRIEPPTVADARLAITIDNTDFLEANFIDTT